MFNFSGEKKTTTEFTFCVWLFYRKAAENKVRATIPSEASASYW